MSDNKRVTVIDRSNEVSSNRLQRKYAETSRQESSKDTLSQRRNRLLIQLSINVTRKKLNSHQEKLNKAQLSKEKDGSLIKELEEAKKRIQQIQLKLEEQKKRNSMMK